MIKINKRLAKRIAAEIPPSVDWEETRNQVDLWTGDLDTWQLDTLTDWVMAELNGHEN